MKKSYSAKTPTLIIFLVSLGLALGIFVIIAVLILRFPAHAKHEIIKTGGMEVMWEINHVFKAYAAGGPFLTTAAGKIFFIGNAEPTRGTRGTVIDSKTGKLIAQTEGMDPSAEFTADGSSFYIGQNDGYVYKYDYQKRQREWTHMIWAPNTGDTKPHCCFQIVNDELQMTWLNALYYRFSVKDGQTIEELNTVRGIYYRYENGIHYHYLGDEYFYAHSKRGNRVWRVKIPRGHPAVFTNDVIYIRSSFSNAGTVYAIDRSTGAILWHSKENVISNVAASPNRAYYLTRDGNLYGVSSKGAEIKTKVQFSPDDFYHSKIGQENAYEVTYDAKTGYVIVLLGDSEQMIAFKETR